MRYDDYDDECRNFEEDFMHLCVVFRCILVY
jgi:hypothetical protein